jgi:TolB-like protein
MGSAGSPLPSAGVAQPVAIYTLGRFQVRLAGAPLRFETRAHRKPLELLKVLIALGGEQVAEELLCDALWPDTEGDLAHSTLGSTLHRLRRLVGSESLLLRDRRLTLSTERCWVDASAFVEALEHASQAAGADDDGAWGHLEQALALYRGPFLQGESGAPEILATRERLHGLFLRHLRDWGTHFAAAAQPGRAALLYQRGLEVDPLAEELYRALMRLYLAQGQLAEGIAVYRRCRELLQSGAGIAPAPETERLYEACLAGRQPAAAQAAPPRPETAQAAPAQVGPPLPEQPSIAILAFDNLSGDPGQEFFADGISENLITRLACIPEMLVIARSSSFAYKGKAVDVRQVGRELGVSHVLEGSVLRAEQRIRVTAQLIDTLSGRHLWAESYDRELKDVFAVQDEITLRVVTELEVQLTMGVHARVIARGTDNVSAHDFVLRARELFIRIEPESNPRARELSRIASALDPNFAWAVAVEGWTHAADVVYGWSADPAGSLRQAEELAHRSLAIDPETQFAHSLLSRVHALHGRLDDAIVSGQRAIELTPNDPYPIALLARVMLLAGRPEEGLALIKKALRLQPHLDNFQIFIAGDCHYFTGHYEEAIQWYRKLLQRQHHGPHVVLSWYFLVASLVALGRPEEARAEARRLLEEHADFTLAAAVQLIRSAPFRDSSFLERQLAGLRKAGLPD